MADTRQLIRQQAAQIHVEQNEVRLHGHCIAPQGFQVFCLGDYAKVRIAREQKAQRGTDDGIAVSHENASRGGHQRQSTIWCWTASATASVRLETPSLPRMLLTWKSAVDGLIIRRSAMARLLSP